MKNVVLFTTYASIIVQLLTGVFDIHALTLQMPPEHRILTPILNIEFFVQIIELGFYFWFVATAVQLKSMAAVRYFDWVITTPTMLFTTIVFMKYKEYLEHHENNKAKDMTVTGFITENRKNIVTIVMCNLAMIALGYMGEVGIIPRMAAFVAGFVAFALSFSVIYHEYAAKSLHGRGLFIFLLGVWSAYGLAFLLDPAAKNITINFLDIVAKNFFGLYLVYVMYKVKGIL